MSTRAWLVVPLVFGSGLCALVYQIAWTRAFRLIFGASTAASAAVVAIFIAGLGAGGLLLGRRVERSGAPLTLYAHLEIAIALLSAATPAVLWLAEAAYLAVGGSASLGGAGSTVARLVLATLVLGAPTFLMGGTLPAVARAVQTDDDAQRRSVALLYGLNTLGAVVGCFLANFLMLEVFGTRLTLWLACLLNLLVGVSARALGRHFGEATPAPARAAKAPSEEPEAESDAKETTTDAPSEEPSDVPVDKSSLPPTQDLITEALAPRPLVLTASAVVGFAFFLMELVWYRMLGPLLGGTVFTFGLILGLALLGIGIGGALYTAFFAHRPARLTAFALTCLLEALFVAFPFAVGDRLATLALLLRPLGTLGFAGHIAGWTVVAGITIVPAAIVAGVQFPVLIALLGRGRSGVGSEIGLTYASNTVGAIVGALAGGFGLLPLLGAPGSWQAVAYSLLAMGVVALAVDARRKLDARRLAAPALVAVVTVALLGARGPTAVWRHSGIGAGRAELENLESPNATRRYFREKRQEIAWEADGVESSVAISESGGVAFVVNGKTDGNARSDAATQVTAGLLGGIIHGAPRTAMVIGLGTGSTAGWLGKIPSIERVDVIELEPAIVEVARRSAPVNEQILDNPKVNLIIGDAREVLRVSSERYSLIFSEPSNPYRAGIASLYTQDFYQAMTERLEDDGLFLQWVQAYEVDAQTVRTVYATLSSVFPVVETWQARSDDMVLVASRKPIVHDVAALRARIASEPYQRALVATWRVRDVEGFLGHYVARPEAARAVYESQPDVLNTDDQPRVEFGFARSVGRDDRFEVQQLVTAAAGKGWSFPEVVGGNVDWARAEYERASIETQAGGKPHASGRLSPGYAKRAEIQKAWAEGRVGDALRLLQKAAKEGLPPPTLLDESITAELAAHRKHPDAAALVAQLRRWNPTEADALEGVRLAHQDAPAAAAAFERAWTAYRTDPWPDVVVMQRALDVATGLAQHDRAVAGRIAASLSAPFAVRVLEEARVRSLMTIDAALGPTQLCIELLAPLEPEVPWTPLVLQYRNACYQRAGHPLAATAEADLLEFISNAPQPFQLGGG